MQAPDFSSAWFFRDLETHCTSSPDSDLTQAFIKVKHLVATYNLEFLDAGDCSFVRRLLQYGFGIPSDAIPEIKPDADVLDGTLICLF